MDVRSTAFLTQVLGADGAQALVKAVERHASLGTVLVPRTIVAWLGSMQTDYEGEIPGVENTYVAIEKGEDSFSGQIAIGDLMYDFQAEPLVRVAAALAVALGADAQAADDLRDNDLARLGKSIDLLVRARGAAAELAKTQQAPRHGTAAEPLKPEEAEAPLAPKKAPVLPRPPLPKGKGYVPPVTKPTVVMPKPKLPGVVVPMAKFMSRCNFCGDTQLVDNKPVGCICIRDLMKSVQFEEVANTEHFILQFGDDLDQESVSTILDSLGVTSAR